MYKDLSNKQKAILQKRNYEIWKKESLENKGFFIIFNGFLDNNYLKNISGGALKLYVFLGIKSKNESGESFYNVKSISEYFGVSTRTISNWFFELERLNLIERYQLDYNNVSHTFLNTYDAGFDRGKIM
ncbi:helix-turn-helix domain-containing protein [Staphylococcus sp. GDY8P57P]|uniref:helix-turn-helix domain-containing protein n=1 Tax=Staphylococcus sp. GDY8P57P TaxID=2804128 RepID=UPI0018872867|nr:helix-turn-helix domain-containing protein [Staphylococcus sp. GDY8P57P]MBF2758193.1 hypothetical protein [Staphylococcus haemolyticus]MBF2773082.1 hypothetical protein [Staphylococcus haemolyticus]MBF2774973.1 hypothetical protein [Staphylococcus haemolyticus]MBF2816787.1 hypothetical protein [Staphylococcus haemolyticus]MBF9720285.1 hypothetical protein [Staphylococcus haemolyticus]